MRTKLLFVVVACAASWSVPLSGATAAPTVVNVRLQDAGSTQGGSMHIALDHDVIKAGPVQFRAVNESGSMVHELVVIRIDAKKPALPYDDKAGTVVEGRVHRLGEIADLEPGASGAVALKLIPGMYVLICNQPGHYKAGMTANLTVTR